MHTQYVNVFIFVLSWLKDYSTSKYLVGITEEELKSRSYTHFRNIPAVKNIILNAFVKEKCGTVFVACGRINKTNSITGRTCNLQ